MTPLLFRIKVPGRYRDGGTAAAAVFGLGVVGAAIGVNIKPPANSIPLTFRIPLCQLSWRGIIPPIDGVLS
jgi:hypothetical protein